jgi:hypothetical protein
MVQVASSFQSPSLRRALNLWITECCTGLRRLHALRKAAAGISRRHEFLAFTLWVDSWGDDVRRAISLDRAGRIWRLRREGAAWRGWSAHIAAHRGRLLALAGLGLHWEGVAARMSFGRWFHWAREAAVRAKVGLGLMGDGSARLRTAVRAWQLSAATLARRRELLAPFGCVATVALRKAAREWRATCRLLRFERWRLQVFEHKVGHVMCAGLRPCYQRWRSSQRLTACSRQAWLKTRRGALRRGMAHWALSACSMRGRASAAALRQEAASHAAAQKAIRALDVEVAHLRGTLEDPKSGRRAVVALTTDVNNLRAALDGAYKLNQKLTDRANHFETQYQALWRATHGPNFVGHSDSPPGSAGRDDAVRMKM